jgi:hypothetical protein
MTDGANREWETISDDFENDESPSKALTVTMPKIMDGGFSFFVLSPFETRLCPQAS